ncbi:MAG: HDOD domain-containing protein [Deltaproteobacteria bacterium]|nr:HDOD domain-containing protein [Deltaproteobacteria bacterium]
MHSQRDLKDISKKIGRLPTLPGVAMQILQAMGRDTPNIREISEIISADAPLSAKVLKMVNSPFYGLSNKIISVHQAMVYLGLNTVKNLALSFSLIKTFEHKNKSSFDYVQFSKDSLVGAIAAKLIAEKTNQKHGENAFFLGLLQNIGMPIMAGSMPNQYEEVIMKTKSCRESFHEVESKLLGLNHMEVGEYVTHAWGLPVSMTEPIGAHHNPGPMTSGSDDIESLIKTLHLSSLYINLYNSSDTKANYAEIENCIRAYGLNSMINNSATVKEITEGIKNLFPIFEIKINEKKYIDIIETARYESDKLSSDLLDQLHNQSECLNQLTQQVCLDGMTQLNNHKSFLEIMHQEIKRATRYKTPLSIIIADVDHFKSVNDFFGHQAGDHALKCVSAHLKKLLRDSDHIARYGGEEFGIILPMTPLKEAIQAAERLRKSIESEKIVYRDRSISVTMSFGVAFLETNRQIDVEGLIKMADEALYDAKNTGRNKCCHYKLQNPEKTAVPTVLVIDDEELVLVTVTKMLERLGFAVLAATSGREASDLLHQKGIKIDMVIMDMVMPDTSPDKMLKDIREIHSESKVVLTSGHNLSSGSNQNLLNKTNGFLQKPYQLTELSQIVQATLNS